MSAATATNSASRKIERVLLIVNPASRRADRLRRKAVQAFAKAHVSCDVMNTEAPGHATTLATTHALKYDAVFTLGGDGTLMEVLGALAHHGPQMRIALATSAGERVVRRAIECGMQIYWFNPMIDEPDQADSRSRQLFDANRLPLINCGGNVGTACWMIADAVLGRRHVAVAGMDFSYYADTPYLNTQYYREALDLVGPDNLDALYVRVFNPYAQKWFYTDPAYLWFRDVFLELAADADCTTYNCTGGGILFGEHIEYVSVEDFIARSQSD
jgi:hypothetical protein